jgi:ADP-ribose pyrophosphatase YjhB (NUDIX family)
VKEWFGSSGLCINDKGQLLMVLQGKPEEKKLWSIPSGGKEDDESFEQCCIREMEEETGYLTEIVEEVKVKRVIYEKRNITAEVHYYTVSIVGGERNIRDPDDLIYDIAWKGLEELKTLKLTYPEDRDFLIQYIRRDSCNHTYIGDYK